jgi:hypothetical protein
MLFAKTVHQICRPVSAAVVNHENVDSHRKVGRNPNQIVDRSDDGSLFIEARHNYCQQLFGHQSLSSRNSAVTDWFTV